MIFRRIMSMYHPHYPAKLVYMLQMVAYSPREFWQWWRRTKDFRTVDYRRQLTKTKAAILLRMVAYAIASFWIVISLLILWAGVFAGNMLPVIIGLALLAIQPIALAIGLLIMVWIADHYVVRPRQNKQINNSKLIFAAHHGTKIAVAGSYGKTTMKEILATVLREGGKVAATPGNKNVAISHARFAETLDGDEDYVIVEFGEGYKGDVRRFTETIQPHVGIVTGLAPNHLDQYESIDELRADLLTLVEFVGPQRAYLSGEVPSFRSVPDMGHMFDHTGVDGWRVEQVKNSIKGLSFVLRKENQKMSLHSQLVGRHLIGPLTVAAVLAKQYGLSPKQIIAGIANTQPFEHRLQPRELHGAWIIDDTYNGSIEGMRVGLALLKELETTGQKRYVTPGLVDQGDQTEAVHSELGKLITDAEPDEVVLMQNSAMPLIRASLVESGYKGKLTIIEEPLSYYENLDLTLAAGDIVLLQNDWTDNYA